MEYCGEIDLNLNLFYYFFKEINQKLKSRLDSGEHVSDQIKNFFDNLTLCSTFDLFKS